MSIGILSHPMHNNHMNTMDIHSNKRKRTLDDMYQDHRRMYSTEIMKPASGGFQRTNSMESIPKAKQQRYSPLPLSVSDYLAMDNLHKDKRPRYSPATYQTTQPNSPMSQTTATTHSNYVPQVPLYDDGSYSKEYNHNEGLIHGNGISHGNNNNYDSAGLSQRYSPVSNLGQNGGMVNGNGIDQRCSPVPTNHNQDFSTLNHLQTSGSYSPYTLGAPMPLTIPQLQTQIPSTLPQMYTPMSAASIPQMNTQMHSTMPHIQSQMYSTLPQIQTPMHPTIPQRRGSAQTSSAFCREARPDEDWTKMSDMSSRRRVQNRIAQRKYRAKVKDAKVTTDQTIKKRAGL